MLRFLAPVISAAWLLAAIGALLDWACPPNLARLDTLGTEVLDRHGHTLAMRPNADGTWRFRADSARLPPALLDLLLRVEDSRFRWHPGVDPIALLRAAGQDLRAGRVVSGGSTLAMQAARLLEPRPRTVRSKLIEVARSLQLQARFGRAGVLDIWLTLAPFGGNLEGIRAGSLAWFGTPAEALEPAQAALLAAIPRRPEALRPDRHPAAAQAVRDKVFAAGVRAGLFGQATLPPVPAGRIALPRHIPQVIAGLQSAPTIRTTIDAGLQAALEGMTAQALERLPDRASVAVVIADAATRQIRALVAGAWGSQPRAGSIDLTQAVRSPGSALKPFIYAMAFSDGIASPEAMVPDLPRRFGGYAPENFDHGFAGGITAAEALRRSLNLPAVALLERVGPLRFAQTLRAAGVPLRLPGRADAALPLALGGAGISLRQLCSLYAALATDGSVMPLRILAGEAAAPAPFLAPDSARAVAGILLRPLPGGGPGGIAWKTGTSWGGRDAWAIGFDAMHVVGVWFGRPDGTPMPAATGTSLALPMLGRVFDLLPPSPLAPAPSPGKSIAQANGSEAIRGDALRLLFPPSNAVLSADGPVTIRAMGGRRPLTFLVDGRPIGVEAARRQAGWHPPGPGFYRITVLDSDGAAVRASVQVRQE